jgi:hypothetical protein
MYPETHRSLSWNESASGSSAGRAGARDLVEPVEEAREGRERPVVRLLLGEEAQHRLGADQPHREPVRILARFVMRRAQVRPRHGLQLAGALVEHQLDVRERLEPAAEARLRPPHALGDCADAAAVGRVRVQHPVGLAEPERAEDDRFRPVGAAHQIESRGGIRQERTPADLR